MLDPDPHPPLTDLGEDLLDGHLTALAPRHRDAWIAVVDLRRTKGHLLVIVLVLDVKLELTNLVGPLLYPLLDLCV